MKRCRLGWARLSPRDRTSAPFMWFSVTWAMTARRHAGSCARGTRRLPTLAQVDSKAPRPFEPAAKAHSRRPPLPLRQAACALAD